MVTDVVQTVEMKLLQPGNHEVEVSVDGTFRYDRSRPFEVELSISGAGRTIATWVFARTLLVQGCREWVGEGDVRVWPEHIAVDGWPFADRVCIELRAGTTCLLGVPRQELSGWLGETYRLVPHGQEGRHFDIDWHIAPFGRLNAPAAHWAQRFSSTRRSARLARWLALHQLDVWGVPYRSGPSRPRLW